MLFPAAHMVNDTYGIMQVRPHLPVAFTVCKYWRWNACNYLLLLLLLLIILCMYCRMTNFVWDGCMLFPAQHMVHDTYGIMQVRPCFPVASKVMGISMVGGSGGGQCWGCPTASSQHPVTYYVVLCSFIDVVTFVTVTILKGCMCSTNATLNDLVFAG